MWVGGCVGVGVWGCGGGEGVCTCLGVWVCGCVYLLGCVWVCGCVGVCGCGCAVCARMVCWGGSGGRGGSDLAYLRLVVLLRCGPQPLLHHDLDFNESALEDR